MKKENFIVTGMTCAACSARVERAVKKLAQVQDVSVNLLTGSMTAHYDESKLSSQDIIAAVEKAGYGASLKGAKSEAQSKNGAKDQELADMKRRLLLSLVFLVPLMFVAMHHHLSLLGIPIPQIFKENFHGGENAVTFAFTQFLLTLGIMYLNRRFFISGFRSLFAGAPNMDSLVAIGSGAAALYGVVSIFMLNLQE